MTYDPILLFKPQGSILKGVAVGKDDFLLAFQTELQHDLLLLYGNNIVCMDATHGTNMYDFYLITVLVVDSHGEGLPVAWLISNHEDTTHITVFLQALKDGVGQVHPKVFMSDDADQYFNSWCSVFGRDGVKKLLCAWHVDRAWRKNLNMHVKDMQVRGEIYHQLLVLLQEQTECGFRLKLQQVVSNLMDKELRFCQYFKAEYVSRLEQWATFARVNVGINTNMMVESFHRKLKVCYLQHKQNRRVDTLLHTLTRRNLIFECFIKSEKGKVTHRVSEINRRHRAAEKLYETGLRAISTESGNEWKIGAQFLKE